MTAHAKPYRFTVDEYARMGDAGVFARGQRVELIEGEIIPLSPHNRPHASRVARLNTLFVRLFGDTHEVRVGLPLTFQPFSEPEPDFAIVALEAADAAERHPSTADLVIEISDSSMEYDRGEKASLYAKAGIMDYWLVNLRHGRVEVRRQPAADPGAFYGFNYALTSVHASGESLTPLAFPHLQLQVTELLGL